MAVMGLALVSCENSKLDPLSGDFLPAPSVVNFTKVDNSEAYKDIEGRRIFIIDLSDNASNKLHAVLVGNKYYLTSNTYSEAPEATAKNGNFITGLTTLNGKTVRQGIITVRENGENYSISAVLFLEDGSPYKAEWVGQLIYVKEALPPVGYSFTIADPAEVTDANSAVVAGVKSNVVTLNDLEGNFAAQLNLILNEGVTDITGRYTVKEYAADDHSAGNGFDLGVYFGMAPGAYVIGSYYMQDGEVVIINPGEVIEVSVEEDVYVFETSGATFVAKPAEKEEPKPVTEVVKLDNFLTYADYFTMYGVPLVGTELATSGIEYTPADYAAGIWMPTYSGTGNFLKIEFYSADGTIAPGTYVPCADANEMNPGEFKIGSSSGGSTWNTVTDGKVESTFITDGTVTVSVSGKTYTIELESSVANAKFVGKLSNEPETVGLTDFLSFTSYAMYGINLAGVELATPGFSYETVIDWTTWTATTTYSGDGQYIKLELYTEGDTLAPGTYVPCANPDVIAPGEFKYGYDNNGTPYGTTWYSVVNNEVSYKYVTDGTVVVEKDNDYYRITITSSAIHATYVGKLSK